MGSLVSIIIPTYNRAELIFATVDSALQQSFHPLELLVCDDGSSDNTQNVISAIGHSSIRWLAGPHTGRPAVPRNRGLREARGEWIAFLDDDDIWLPEKLEWQLNALQQTGCLASCTNAWRVIDGKRVGHYINHKQPEVFNFDYLLKSNMVICSSVVIHRSLINEVQGFPENETLTAIEDYALWLRVATKTDFVYINQPFIEYTDKPSKSIRKRDSSEYAQKIEIVHDFLKWAVLARCRSKYIFLAGMDVFRQVLKLIKHHWRKPVLSNRA